MGKLREALGMAAAAREPVPELRVPEADKVTALVEEAERGFTAIHTLFEDRNRMSEMNQMLHRKDVYNSNVNNTLRAQNHQLQQRNERLLKAYGALGAYLNQARDLFERINSEMTEVTAMMQQMPPMPHVTNNPDAPPLNAIGLPIEESDGRAFDKEGIPHAAAGAAPTVSHEDLKSIIREMEQRESGNGAG